MEGNHAFHLTSLLRCAKREIETPEYVLERGKRLHEHLEETWIPARYARRLVENRFYTVLSGVEVCYTPDVLAFHADGSEDAVVELKTGSGAQITLVNALVQTLCYASLLREYGYNFPKVRVHLFNWKGRHVRTIELEVTTLQHYMLTNAPPCDDDDDNDNNNNDIYNNILDAIREWLEERARTYTRRGPVTWLECRYCRRWASACKLRRAAKTCQFPVSVAFLHAYAFSAGRPVTLV